MQQCSRCNRSFDDALRTCPECGTVVASSPQPGQQAPKNCISCMEEIPYTALVCPHCNEKQPGRPVGTPQESFLEWVGKLWNSKYCIQCNASIHRDVQVCPQCGANQDSTPQPVSLPRKHCRPQTWLEQVGELWNSKYCVECNARIKREEQQCPNCGAHQDGSKHPPPVGQVKTEALVEDKTTTPQPAPIAVYPTTPDTTILGKRVTTPGDVVVTDVDRQSGMYVLGVQGTGKSSFLETLIHQDIAKGLSVIVLDPHGDLIEHVIAQMPEDRLQHTFLLDMEDEEYPFGVNLFSTKKTRSSREEAQAVDRVMHVFEVLWSDVLSQQYLPRFLRAATLTLLANPGSTFVDMYSLLQDDAVRLKLLQQVKDTSVKEFWEYQYNNVSPSVRRKEVAPLVNRLEALFMGRSLVRNILGQRETTIDFRKAIEQKQIILLRLPIQTLPQDAALIGTMLVAAIHAAIFSFADVPLEARPGFSFYIDEFQKFATADIEEIFTQGRKFGSRLCVAHQGRYQIPDFLASATTGARTVVTFQTNKDDGSDMAKLYTGLSQEARIDDISKNAVDQLPSYVTTSTVIEKFVKTYLLPLQSMASGKRIKVTTWQPSIAKKVWGYDRKKETPEVDNPLSFLNTLLFEVQVRKDAALPIPVEVIAGFSNCGSGYYNLWKKLSAEERTHLGQFSAVAPLANREKTRNALYGDKREIEQLLDFLVTLRSVMVFLAKTPIATKRGVTPSDVAQMIVSLPKRTALVKILENVSIMRTLDAPGTCARSELVRRKKRIQDQTRQTYCTARLLIGQHQDTPKQQEEKDEEPGRRRFQDVDEK